MHHKLLIADGRYLATGSYNWSRTAEKENAENIQIIDGSVAANTALVGEFQAEFDGLWDQNRSKVAAITAVMKTPPTGKCIPIHWDSSYFKMVIALDRKEYTAMRTTVSKAGLYRNRDLADSRCLDVTTGTFSKTGGSGVFVDGLGL